MHGLSLLLVCSIVRTAARGGFWFVRRCRTERVANIQLWRPIIGVKSSRCLDAIRWLRLWPLPLLWLGKLLPAVAEDERSPARKKRRTAEANKSWLPGGRRQYRETNHFWKVSTMESAEKSACYSVWNDYYRYFCSGGSGKKSLL